MRDYVDLSGLRKFPKRDDDIGKREKIYIGGVVVFLVGLFFGVIETWYFGWNWEAESINERICDWIAQIIRHIGLIAIGWSFCSRPDDVKYFSGPIIINRNFGGNEGYGMSYKSCQKDPDDVVRNGAVAEP